MDPLKNDHDEYSGFVRDQAGAEQGVGARRAR